MMKLIIWVEKFVTVLHLKDLCKSYTYLNIKGSWNKYFTKPVKKLIYFLVFMPSKISRNLSYCYKPSF